MGIFEKHVNYSFFLEDNFDAFFGLSKEFEQVLENQITWYFL